MSRVDELLDLGVEPVAATSDTAWHHAARPDVLSVGGHPVRYARYGLRHNGVRSPSKGRIWQRNPEDVEGACYTRAPSV